MVAAQAATLVRRVSGTPPRRCAQRSRVPAAARRADCVVTACASAPPAGVATTAAARRSACSRCGAALQTPPWAAHVGHDLHGHVVTALRGAVPRREIAR